MEMTNPPSGRKVKISRSIDHKSRSVMASFWDLRALCLFEDSEKNLNISLNSCVSVYCDWHSTRTGQTIPLGRSFPEKQHTVINRQQRLKSPHLSRSTATVIIPFIQALDIEYINFLPCPINPNLASTPALPFPKFISLHHPIANIAREPVIQIPLLRTPQIRITGPHQAQKVRFIAGNLAAKGVSVNKKDSLAMIQTDKGARMDWKEKK